MNKTNALRLLEAAGIAFRTAKYAYDENDLSGLHAAKQLGEPPEKVFKTLVLKGERKGYFVCCIPVCRELDLKKAAKAIGDKKCEMLHVKDLLGVTGYIRGGCSPVGMKKKFPTFIDKTALTFDEIAVSAGMRGMQVILAPDALGSFIQADFLDITL